MAKKKKKKKSLPKALPETFVARLKDIVGPSLFDAVYKTFTPKTTSFRANTLCTTREAVRDTLVRDGFKLEQVPWYKDAFLLRNKSKRELTETDLYKNGHLYIQSLASMVPPLVLDPRPGDRVLDLAAAPGSKTSQIAALMGAEGELVANDVNKVRFFRLQANMQGLHVTDARPGWECVLRNEDGSVLTKEYPEYFDRILVDAICSSEARFIDGDPKTYGYWSEHKIKQVSYRQHKLLLAAWSALKPGGTLVYSTCTLAPEENEMRVQKLIERLGNDLEVLSAQVPGLKTVSPLKSWKNKLFDASIEKTMRIYPTKDIEAFFVAHIRKI